VAGEIRFEFKLAREWLIGENTARGWIQIMKYRTWMDTNYETPHVDGYKL